MRIEFVGGPHDGLQLSSGLGAPFLWSDGKRCFRAPGRARALYQYADAFIRGTIDEVSGQMRQEETGKRYRFIGHTHGLCVCGAFRKRRPKRCKMCGEEEFVG